MIPYDILQGLSREHITYIPFRSRYTWRKILNRNDTFVDRDWSKINHPIGKRIQMIANMYWNDYVLQIWPEFVKVYGFEQDHYQNYLRKALYFRAHVPKVLFVMFWALAVFFGLITINIYFLLQQLWLLWYCKASSKLQIERGTYIFGCAKP